MASMPSPPQRTAGGSTALWAATVLVALIGVALTLIAWDDLVLGDSLANSGCAIAGVVYATLGALIVRRARNVIGWLLQGVGLGLAILSLASAYAVVGIANHRSSLPAPEVVGAIAVWAFVVTAPSLAFMLFLFPTGTLPSRRWRPILLIGFAAIALTSIGFLVNPVPLALPAPGGAFRIPNPLGIESLGSLIAAVLVGTVWAIVLTIAAAFIALVVRYRAGSRELRQQVKWVAFVAALALLANVVATGALVACNCDNSQVATIMYIAVVFLVFFGMPAALAIAILKYQLYEIDVIINRTVVYGMLAAALTAVYVGVVIGVGTIIGRRGSSLAHNRRGGGDRVAVPAVAAACATPREPVGVRRAGDALSGAFRLRRASRWHVRSRRRAAAVGGDPCTGNGSDTRRCVASGRSRPPSRGDVAGRRHSASLDAARGRR